ncbi:MAG: hypothetical protein VCA36_07570 [Opitutales bacterium]
MQPNDVLNGGVALKATSDSVELHPYVFRQVCSNGLIMGWASQSSTLHFASDATLDEMIKGEIPEVVSPDQFECKFREAIAECCRKEVFVEATQKFHASMHFPVQRGTIEMALYASLSPRKFEHAEELRSQIIHEFLGQGGEPTLFHLVNAVTAVAREQPDPQVKWDLECFGGELARLRKPPSQAQRASAKSLPAEPPLALV